MDIYKPYTYHLYHKPTNKHYYGCRYANRPRDIANPSDLWSTYFTSSKYVKQLIEEYGVDSFIVSVRKTFDTAEQTLKWEAGVLKKFNASSNNHWLNCTNGFDGFDCIGPKSEGHKAKIGKANSKALAGKKLSEETKRKISESLRGKKKSAEHVEKVRSSQAGKPRNPISVERMRQTKTGKPHTEVQRLAQRKYFENRKNGLSARDRTPNPSLED